MKRNMAFLGALLLVFSLMTSGCGQKPHPTQPPFTTAAATISTTVPTEPSVEATEPPAEPTAAVTEPTVFTEPPHLPLTASHSFIYRVNTGEVYYAKGKADDRIYPASLTKLFTAYVALQYLEPEKSVTAGAELEFVGKGSSVAWIGKGSRLTVEMLIRAMLLPSGNDAAYVTAAAAGRVIANDPNLSAPRAVERFVEEMNRQAQELELFGTHFTSPDGYHNDDHYTTMADMAQITVLAMDTRLIRDCVAMTHAETRFLSGETITWRNTNSLLDPKSKYYRYSAMGIKTGYTKKAGYCLLSAFDLDGCVYVIGVFGCPEFYDRYDDTLYILSLLEDE